MKVVAGLGNPEDIYQGSRHNVGFDFISMWEKIHNNARASIELLDSKYSMPIISSNINGENVAFIKPQAGMNNSGLPIKAFMNTFELAPKDLVVVFDDMDINLGSIRIRGGGSAGGHNGIKSIISEIGPNFTRIKIGIGKPNQGQEIIDYVLSPFNSKDRELVNTAMSEALVALKNIFTLGVEKAMSNHNRSQSNGK